MKRKSSYRIEKVGNHRGFLATEDMTMGLSDFNAKSGGNNGDRKPTENVLFKVKSFHIAGDKPDAEKDYVIGILLADACGKKRGDEVKIRVAVDPQLGKRKQPRWELMDYRDGVKKKLDPVRASADPKEGGVLEIQRAYWSEKEGGIVGAWTKAVVVDPTAGVEHAFPALYTCVAAEEKNKEGDKTYQNVTVLNTSEKGVKLVTSQEEFEKAAREILQKTESAPGESGFVLRIINMNAQTPDTFVKGGEEETWESERTAAAIATRGRKETNGTWDNESIDSVLERFNKGKGGKLAQIIGTDGLVAELIPTMRFRVGKDSLPSQNDKGTDLSKPFRRSEKDKWGGYAQANVQIKKRDKNDSWYVAHVRPASQGPVIVNLRDVPTANMPAAMVAAIEAEAKSRAPKNDAQDSEEHGASPNPGAEARGAAAETPHEESADPGGWGV